MKFKVNDFVYFKNISMCPEMEDRYGYGTILEIKDLPVYLGSDEIAAFAIIQVKYFEDGTPCTFNTKEVIKLELLEPAESAWENKVRELDEQRRMLTEMYNEMIKDNSFVETFNEI